MFGQNRVDCHFDTASASKVLDNLIKQNTDDAQLFLLCTSFSEASGAEGFLVETFGQNNFHPAYVSKSQDDVCFVLSAKRSQAAEIESTEKFR